MNSAFLVTLAIAIGFSNPPDMSNLAATDPRHLDIQEISTGPGSAYEISWHTIDGGGGTSAGGGFELAGTIGQCDAGVMSGGGYQLTGGFWAGGLDGGQPPACSGDLNGDTVVDVSDLLTLLGAWGPCPGCAADLNGDGVVDVSDLLMLLGAWGACE